VLLPFLEDQAAIRKIFVLLPWTRRVEPYDVNHTHNFSAVLNRTQSIDKSLVQAKPTYQHINAERTRHASEETMFPFMDLPAELRRVVYSFLVSNMGVTTEIRRQALDFELRRDGDRCCMALLRTNRKIYRDVPAHVHLYFFQIRIRNSTLRGSNRDFL
jgi:hypothetical protein